MGRKTYDAAKKMCGGGCMPGMKTIVFSRTHTQADCPEASLLSLGLVDTVEIAVIPVLLGNGLPLLPAPVSGRKLELTKHQLYQKTGTLLLEYRVH